MSVLWFSRPDAWNVTRPANRPNYRPEPGSQPSYLLLAPAGLRPGLPFSVSVSILGSSSVSVSAEIVYEKETLSSNSTTIKGGSTRLLTLPAIHQVGSSPGWTYTLKVRGRRGSVQLFSNSTELHVDPRGVSTFIQTNQPRYLPGQVVKIRTVSVRSNGKPCSEPADVLIRDPRGNLLRQWLDKDGVLGVVSTEFQLSENPPLGEWSIMATLKGVSSVKRFSVDYYVLPKFEVLVKVPDVVHWEDVLKGFVSAKYFYGKPVRGRMAVTFSRRYHGDDQTHSEEAEMDGSGKFRFDVSLFSAPWSRMLIRDERPDVLSVQVSVTEHLTGLTCNSTVSVSLAKSRFSVTFEDFPKVLRPSLSFSGTLKVSTYNGEPLQDQRKLRVSVKQRRSRQTVDQWSLFPKNSSDSSWMDWDESSSEDMELPVPVDGLVPLHIQVQRDTQRLTVAVSLEDCEKTLSVDRSFRSQSRAYLQVQKPSSPAQVGSRLRLRVEKNFQIPDVHYLVKSRGQVVSAGSSSGDVSLVPEASWAPLASVVVYCVHPGGEVINDVIHLPVTHFLQNKVTHLLWTSCDLLGPSISGLDSLVQMPFGCGEQNMIHFAPNVHVLRYLSARGPLDPALQNRATDYMLKGYERQLSYQRADGSFSAFGQQDSSGSTWLTAFVLRCLLQARPWVGVDGRVLESAAAWLAAQRTAGGAAAEPGTVIHSELQGGLDGPVSLTAYVLVALLEDGYIRAQYAAQVTSALAYLEARLDQGVSSNYSLSLLSYALALAGSPASHAALNRLIGRADLRDGVPTWSSPDAGLSSSWQPRSADIEMASYVLLSLYELNRVDEGLSLMRWLSQQRNHLGGYGSTQDTVVALQALSAFAALQGSQRSDLDVTVTNGDSGVVASFHIDQDNFLLLQSRQIDPEPVLDLQVTASGRGLALLQLNVFYNVRSQELLRMRSEEQEAFHLQVALSEQQDDAHLLICSSLARHLGLNETGMVLMEVGLLSGFSARPDLVPLGGAVKRVETEPGRAVLYLDSVSTQESCLLVPLLVEFKVARVQEASVSVYDYYEPRRRTVRSYRSSWRSHVSSCVFCGLDCSRCRASNDYELNAAPRCSRHFLLRHFLLRHFLLLLFVTFSA
ncbi:CD109 antigen [Poecilia reticulata]|uniref:CD109 antigen n=1 Tax=Poecilia reticulata TaxID=8081 RepID=UPI0007EB961B|nr:PREDICTED: CD109 antigen-like [Poecilia reticulata]